MSGSPKLCEKGLEAKLRIEVKKLGGRAIKLTNPNHIPDRLILLPGKGVYFAEMKSPGEKARPGQKAMHQVLRLLGFEVFVIDTKELLQEFLTICENYILRHRSTITKNGQ